MVLHKGLHGFVAGNAQFVVAAGGGDGGAKRAGDDAGADHPQPAGGRKA